jgi:hypothetical protein
MRHEGDTIVAADGNPPPLLHAVSAASKPQPVKTLPNQFAFRRPRNAVFLSLIAANQRKLLSINNLQQKPGISN